jgi:hypothetical protein
MIADFSGMLPLRDPILLPDVNAQFAENTWLYEGAVRGFRQESSVYTILYADTQLVYRIPITAANPPDFSATGSIWMEFPDPYMAAIRNPTVGDQWDRYYFFPSDQYNSTGANPEWPTSSPGPVYNTLANIQSGTPMMPLGVPVPVTAPTVTPSIGGSVQESRAYVYTMVTAYSEEGCPSPPTVANGFTDAGAWIIDIPPPPAGTGTNVEDYRLYRTVTDSSGNATYYQVQQVAINWAGYTQVVDGAADASITANQQLQSINYLPPPPGLQGVVLMANGIAAGYTNSREIWFSEPYLPHAWPAVYALTVDYPVVGLTANGTSLNIMTEGSPFIATGVTPDTMTIGKIVANEPCIGRGSIVAGGEGAYYASPNGYILLNTGGTSNVTDQIFEKEFWYQIQPWNLVSGRYSLSMACFIKGMGAPSIDPNAGDYINGSVIDFTDTNVPFTYLKTFTPIVNALTDELSGQIFYITDNQVYQWNPPNGGVLWPWIYKTKKFRFTFPQQFKAFMVLFDIPPEVTFLPGIRNTDQTQEYDPTTQYLICRVFGDGEQLVVREVQQSGEVLLIPHGAKWTQWEFQFEGVIRMKFFKAATSVKELKVA